MSIGPFNNLLIELLLHILSLSSNVQQRSIVMHPVRRHK